MISETDDSKGFRTMTVTIESVPGGGYTYVSDPDRIVFNAKNGPRYLTCNLELGPNVPVDAFFQQPTYTPSQYMTDVQGVGSQQLTITFMFQDTKVDGHLTFAFGGLGEGEHRFDPQVGNDPPPHTEDPC